MAKAKGVPVRFEDRQQIDRLVGTHEHQGVAALGAAKPAIELEDLLAARSAQGLLVLLMESKIHTIWARSCGLLWLRARMAW